MIRVASLSTVRAQKESVEAALLPPDVERRHISEEVVHPVAVWRVLLCRPLVRERKLSVHTSLNFALIVDAIEPNDPLQENVKLRVT